MRQSGTIIKPLNRAMRRVLLDRSRRVVVCLLALAMALGSVPLPAYAQALADEAVEQEQAVPAEAEPKQEEPAPEPEPVPEPAPEPEPEPAPEPEVVEKEEKKSTSKPSNKSSKAKSNSKDSAAEEEEAPSVAAAPENTAEPVIKVKLGSEELVDKGKISINKVEKLNITVNDIDANQEAWSVRINDKQDLIALTKKSDSELELKDHELDLAEFTPSGALTLVREVEGESKDAFTATVFVDTEAPMASEPEFNDISDVTNKGTIKVSVVDNLDSEGLGTEKDVAKSYLVLLDADGNESGSKIAFGDDGSAQIDISGVAEGTYAGVKVVAADKAGNVNAADKQLFPRKVADTETPFIVDKTAPEISVAYFDDGTGAELSKADVEGKVVNYPVKAVVTVKDKNIDTSGMTLTAPSGTIEGSWNDNGDGSYSLTVRFLDTNAGHSYTVEAQDKAGNTATAYEAAFTIDTTLPAVEVAYEGSPVASSTEPVDGTTPGLFADSRNATITVSDANIDTGLLGEGTAVVEYYKIEGNETSTEKSTETINLAADSWTQGDGDVFTYTLEHSEERVYTSILVAVKDAAGNANDSTAVSGESPIFEIDATAPKISVSYANAKTGDELAPEDIEDGKANFPVKVAVSVDERNFDQSATHVLVDGEESTAPWTESPEKAGVRILEFEVPVDWVKTQEHSLSVTSIDKVGHEAQAYNSSFQIDVTPPVIEVAFEGDADAVSAEEVEGKSIDLFKNSRTLVITAKDENASLKGLGNGTAMLTAYEINENKTADEPKTVSVSLSKDGWTQLEDGVFEYRLEIKTERVYTRLEVSVADDLGNNTTDSECYDPEGGELTIEGNSIFTPENPFEVDATAPVLTVAYENADTAESVPAKDIESGKINYPVKVTITVNERNFDLEKTKALFDGQVPDGGWNESTSKDGEHVLSFVVPVDWATPQLHTISASTTDKVGLSAKPFGTTFQIDVTPPILEVTFEGNAAAQSNEKVDDKAIDLFKDSRLVKIVARDENASLMSIGKGSATLTYYKIEGNKTSAEPETMKIFLQEDKWIQNDDGSFEYDLEVKTERIYTMFQISVEDDLGNNTCDSSRYNPSGAAPTLEGNSIFVPARPFEIDSTAPVVTMSKSVKPDGTMGEKDVYGRELVVTYTVTERNFKDSDFPVVVPEGATGSGWVSDPSRAGVHEYTVTYSAEGHYGESSIAGKDMVGHALKGKRAAELVLDLSVPVVDKATVSTTPSNIAEGARSGHQFHNRATTVHAEFHDGIGIKEASFVGSGYSATPNIAEGTVDVVLAEGTDFGEAAFLTLVDYAGNRSIWSISPEGEVKLVHKEATHPANTPITAVTGNLEHPELLILDTTAPQVSLEGAEAGTYYASDQAITATIVERNFAYTNSQDGAQVVMTILFRAGYAGAPEQTFTTSASAFGGSGDVWSYVRGLSEDGHYSVQASVVDFAQNTSNSAFIGEFTIDKTAPTISVAFDNHDARNGKYYKDPRHATITVVEHNFDPSLIQIDTNGFMGMWNSNGDVHTCVVSFDRDGVFNLAVTGADMAGNQAGSYAADEFVVDLTAPQITITNYDGEAMDHVAYDGTVSPVIWYFDEANFDTAYESTTWEMSRSNGTNNDPLPASSVLGSNSRTVSWDDFAYQMSVDDIYTIKAHMVDLAGNEADAEVVFSVNRFGSNFEIVRVDTEKNEWSDASDDRREEGTVLLASAPTIQIREINVSGANPEIDPADAHFVDVEHANATDSVALVESNRSGGGYVLEERSSQRAGTQGWAEYHYTILSGNFGEENAAYANDGGQGSYDVTVGTFDNTEGITRDENGNVTSYGRINTSGVFYENQNGIQAEAHKTVGFILDEKGPEIVSVDVPENVEINDSYRVTVAVRDDVGGENDVFEAAINGVPVADADIERMGAGTYSFKVDAELFGLIKKSNIDVKVTDYDGRSDMATASFNITTFLGEGMVIAGSVGLVAVITAVLVYKRKKDKEAA